MVCLLRVVRHPVERWRNHPQRSRPHLWRRLGLGIGLIAIFAIGTGGLATVVALAIGVATMALLGSLRSGIVAPWRVVLALPRSAHRQADEHIARALEACADLLTESYKTITSGKRRDVNPLQDHIERGLQEARVMSVPCSLVSTPIKIPANRRDMI